MAAVWREGQRLISRKSAGEGVGWLADTLLLPAFAVSRASAERRSGAIEYALPGVARPPTPR